MVEITGYQIQGKDGLNAFTDDQRQTFETFEEAVSFADEIWERAEQINAQTEDENRKLKKEDYRIASYKNGVILGNFPLFQDSSSSYSEDIAVKEFRKETGMSQRQFAEYFKLSVRTLQEWEQGRQKPPEYLLELLKRIWQLEGHGKEGEKAERTVFEITEGFQYTSFEEFKSHYAEMIENGYTPDGSSSHPKFYSRKDLDNYYSQYIKSII